MGCQDAKGSPLARLLKRPAAQTDLGDILRALPAGIPYLGDIYSDIKSSAELEAVEHNLALVAAELRRDLQENSDLLHAIADTLASARDPIFRLDADIRQDEEQDTIAFLSFTLSNAGGGIVQVPRIWLEVVRSTECPQLHRRPWGKGDGIENHRWHVRLNPAVAAYALGDTERKFAGGEIDRFTVTVTADAHCEYEVRLCVQYQYVTGVRMGVLRTPLYRLHLLGAGSHHALAALAGAWARDPALMSQEPPFGVHGDLVDFFQRNAPAFVALPELVPEFIEDPNGFVSLGAEMMADRVKERLQQDAVQAII